jgi:hypothetical protein
MCRLPLLAVAPALLVPLGSRPRQSAENNIEIFGIDLAGRQTNHTHNPALDVNPAVAPDGT